MYTLSLPEALQMAEHIAVGQNNPVMLWGPSGVGKTEGVNQLAKRIDAFPWTVILGQYDSVDLKGYPGKDDKGFLSWCPASTLPFVGNDAFPDDKIILLILDEVNSASPPVFAVAYQLLQEGRIGEHSLKPNVRIVAMGNRESDRGVVNRMPMPLNNRLVHAEVGVDVDAICDYWSGVGIPPVAIAFHQFRSKTGNGLMHTFDPAKTDKAFATPRSWEKALRYYMADMPENVKRAAIAGTVGDGPAAEFWGFVKVWQSVIPIATIIKDPMKAALPEEVSLQYATAMHVSGNMSAKTVGPLHTYLKRIDSVFCVLAWQMAYKRDNSLVTTPEFVDFSKVYEVVF